jgi:hypothetical protein
VGGSERVISYCAEEHSGRGVYLNKGGIEYSKRSRENDTEGKGGKGGNKGIRIDK